jgi:two-component sensor histidine kinase
MLLREVNHRVGNSLQIIASLLHLQANSSTQDDVKAALTNAMGRVAAVAQVHRRLYTSHDLKKRAAEPVSRCPARGSCGAPPKATGCRG